jgi:hypothetical protein
MLSWWLSSDEQGLIFDMPVPIRHIRSIDLLPLKAAIAVEN